MGTPLTGCAGPFRRTVGHSWRRITPGLGGSATNDGGYAAALGVKFLGQQLKAFDHAIYRNLGVDVSKVHSKGRLDRQSIDGKAISGVASRARKQNVSVIVIAVSIAEELEDSPRLYALDGTAASFINRQAQDFSMSGPRGRENYTHTFSSILRLLSTAAGI